MAAACGHCGQLHEAYVTVCPITGGRLGSASYTLVNEDEALVGTVIGERYHLRDILGQGSTGTVFGTVHAHFERRAAMKVLRPRLTMLDTVQRVFHDESRRAFSISHPSLVEVFDIGSLPDGAPFFVMELLEGDTLASRLGRERFSIAAAVDLMMQLLSAMEAVHAREVLFRDLRPQNIFLVNRRGCRPVLKVLDFGLGRLIPIEKVQQQWDGLRAVVGPNDASSLLSIPYYLSPERTRGDQGLEPASDIFVAATILYEALTAQKPFNGSTWSTLLTQIAQGQPAPLTVLRPDVPEDLGALVMRALSSKPRARPASAREMQDELRSVFEAPRRGSASMRAAPVSAAAANAANAASAASPASEPPPNTSRSERSIELTPFVGRAPMPNPRPAAGMRPEQMLPIAPAPAPAPPPQPERRARSTEEMFDDETRTDQKPLDVTVVAAAVDEASAEHPVRTVRPPSSVDFDIDVVVEPDPATSRGGDLTAALSRSLRRSDEDDETETMQLTPEVRRRIEQMTKQAAPQAAPPPANQADDATRPPPTRRLK
jgi:serine/threonine-protein kinase